MVNPEGSVVRAGVKREYWPSVLPLSSYLNGFTSLSTLTLSKGSSISLCFPLLWPCSYWQVHSGTVSESRCFPAFQHLLRMRLTKALLPQSVPFPAGKQLAEGKSRTTGTSSSSLLPLLLQVLTLENSIFSYPPL